MSMTLVAAVLSFVAPHNPSPVIGVLSQPIDASLQPLCPTCKQYTVASYIKWVEAAGARVALLQYNGTSAMLSASFAQLSGLVIPGGHCGFHGTAYGAAVAALLQMAERAGDFPVWGTCQGFQQMAQYAATGTATHPSVLHRTGNGTEGIALPLAFADSDPRSTTRLFAGAPARVLTTLATKPVTVNLHHYSLLANESAQHPSLAAYFKVVATNTVDGVEFVSLMEGRTLPWYASQFHGEKNAFEWDQSWCKSPRLDAAEAHSAEAVEAMGYLATVVVAEARKCGHRWAGGVARSLALSYAVQPFATVSSDDAWEQCYLQ